MKNYKKAYVLMAGGITQSLNLKKHVTSRCEFIISEYKKNKDFLLILSSSFSLNVPVKLRNSLPISESSVIYHWLRENGYEGPIVCEQQSHDTIGSIFFIFSLYVKYLNIKEVSFVSSDFHIRRIQIISEHLKNLFCQKKINVRYIGIPFVQKTKNRKQHENNQIEQYLNNFIKFKAPNHFFNYLINHHTNYNYKFTSKLKLIEKFLY